MPASPNIKASGNIAIVWGTANAANGGAGIMPTGMILETLTISPKNAEPIEIEGNDGFAAVQVLVADGFNAKATGVLDTNKAMPTAGQNVVLVVPKTDGNAGTTNVNCTFWSWATTKARKKEQLVELNFTYRPEINS